MIRITVYAGPSATDEREASVTVRDVGASEVTEILRQIGLEWKQADYMPQRQVVITLDPVTDFGEAVDRAARDRLQELVRALDA